MFLVSFGILVFYKSLKENCNIYMELQRSGKISLQSYSGMGDRVNVAAVLLKTSELELTQQLVGVVTSTQGNQSVWCASHPKSARVQ
jgi:hypothetical protein